LRAELARLNDQHGGIVPKPPTASGHAAVSLVRLAELLMEHAGFDMRQAYRPGSAEAVELGEKRIRLARREAEIRGVEERCRVGETLAEAEVRYFDLAGGGDRREGLLGNRYTDPGLERIYPMPWTRADREEEYRIAWEEFERRAGSG
jgi:hypothetical protein